MGNDCGIEVATAAITFETEATLNKKRGGLTLIYSVVVQPRCPIEIRNFVITMLESQQQQQQNNDMVDKRKKIFLSKGHATTTTELSLNSDKTSLNSTLTKNVRVGKPNLSISYSWSDRRTAKKEKSKKSRRRRSKRRRKRKKNKTIQDSSDSEAEQNTKSRRSSSKWKKMITPRRKRKQKKKKPITLKKKRPPLPLYAPNPKTIFPQNQHPVQIQFIEECPAAVDLCVIFNSNTATHKFTGNTTGPFRTTGGQRRIYRASDRSCFDFSNEITRQKKHYNHCFSVEFQVEKVRYVTHFQETERVVVLWAKEINGLYHGYGYDNDDVTAQTLLNVPVLLCLPNHKLAVQQQQQQQPQITSQFRRRRQQGGAGAGGAELKGEMEIMDLMICDSKSTAWLKHRKVQLFPVHQIKAADIQSYMSQAQYKNNEEAQSSCSDAASLARKKKKQDHHRKKKRNRSRFWQRSRAQIKEITPVPELEVHKEPVLLGPPPGLDLIALRRITKATHPGIQGLTSVENSSGEAFTLTDSTYSICSSSSPSASISSTSASGRISQPSSPSGETTIESFSMSNTTATTLSDGSSWFTDSEEEEEVSPYELVEEEEESSSYIQLQKDSTDRIISDSIETASATSSATSASSSSRHRRRRHQKKKKNHNQIPVFNLKPIIIQRESLLEGIAKKMQNEIQEIENPQTVSPRFPSYLLPLDRKISADQETTESSNTGNGYNALLSPRSEISPRLCKQHREDIMKRAQQKRDGTSDSDIAADLKKDIDKQVEQKQREHLVNLLNEKTAKKLEKSPRKRIKKIGKVLSSQRLPTTTATKNRELYKKLNRQNSLRNNSSMLPKSLYASTGSLPIQSTTTKSKRTLKKK